MRVWGGRHESVMCEGVGRKRHSVMCEGVGRKT